MARQKWDELLSPKLLRETYANSNLDLDEARVWLAQLAPCLKTTASPERVLPNAGSAVKATAPQQAVRDVYRG
ncbi:hypothetical protein GCM10027564_31660 [Luteimonas notoginsengisoli]